MPDKILIIDDDTESRNTVSRGLAAGGFRTYTASTGIDAALMICSCCPDAILLESLKRGIDAKAIELLEKVRRCFEMPVILLSEKVGEETRIRALQKGADDYIEMPVSLRELSVRIAAALRRGRGIPGSAVLHISTRRIGELIIDFTRHRVYIRGYDAGLTRNEYRLISLLGKFAGKILPYEYLIRQVWGPNASVDNQILRVNITNTRRKIERRVDEPRYILTIRGVGYYMPEK